GRGPAHSATIVRGQETVRRPAPQQPLGEGSLMRMTLILVGVLCCLIGGEFLFVDKIVLHPPVPRGARTARDDDEPQPVGRVIDLPDAGGYVLLAVGVVCLLYSVALRRQKER